MKIEVFPSSQFGAKSRFDRPDAGRSSGHYPADGAFYADRGVPDFGILWAISVQRLGGVLDADGERSLCRSVQ